MRLHLLALILLFFFGCSQYTRGYKPTVKHPCKVDNFSVLITSNDQLVVWRTEDMEDGFLELREYKSKTIISHLEFVKPAKFSNGIKEVIVVNPIILSIKDLPENKYTVLLKGESKCIEMFTLEVNDQSYCHNY